MSLLRKGGARLALLVPPRELRDQPNQTQLLYPHNATRRGFENSLCSCDNKRTARIASAVERPTVKPDCCGLQHVANCPQQNCCQFVARLLLDTKGYMLP